MKKTRGSWVGEPSAPMSPEPPSCLRTASAKLCAELAVTPRGVWAGGSALWSPAAGATAARSGAPARPCSLRCGEQDANSHPLPLWYEEPGDGDAGLATQGRRHGYSTLINRYGEHFFIRILNELALVAPGHTWDPTALETDVPESFRLSL